MTDNLSYAWRAIPLDQIMPYSRLLDDFERAGYETAGDVLDAEPWDLVDNVYGVGPKRAIQIRQKVFDYVKPFGSQIEGMPNWVLLPADVGKPVRRTTAADIISAACVATAIGLIAYLLAWVVL